MANNEAWFLFYVINRQHAGFGNRAHSTSDKRRCYLKLLSKRVLKVFPRPCWMFWLWCGLEALSVFPDIALWAPRRQGYLLIESQDVAAKREYKQWCDNPAISSAMKVSSCEMSVQQDSRGSPSSVYFQSDLSRHTQSVWLHSAHVTFSFIFFTVCHDALTFHPLLTYIPEENGGSGGAA